jgi:hypothetical protein
MFPQLQISDQIDVKRSTEDDGGEGKCEHRHLGSFRFASRWWCVSCSRVRHQTTRFSVIHASHVTSLDYSGWVPTTRMSVVETNIAREYKSVRDPNHSRNITGIPDYYYVGLYLALKLKVANVV